MQTQGIFVVALLAASAAGQAQTSPSMQMSMPMKASAPAHQGSVVMTNGVIQKVDAAGGVVTLRHEDIANMGMPAMTMGFSVADKKMLSRVKAGDKVRFHVEMLKGTPTITQIEAAH